MTILILTLLSSYPGMCLKLFFHSSGTGQIVHCRLDTENTFVLPESQLYGNFPGIEFARIHDWHLS